MAIASALMIHNERFSYRKIFCPVIGLIVTDVVVAGAAIEAEFVPDISSSVTYVPRHTGGYMAVAA